MKSFRMKLTSLLILTNGEIVVGDEPSLYIIHGLKMWQALKEKRPQRLTTPTCQEKRRKPHGNRIQNNARGPLLSFYATGYFVES